MSNSTVGDFRQWAFSDLCSKDIRGVFTECLVAKLLNVELTGVRDCWASRDLETPEGVKIEVKCSVYLQTWRQPWGPSQIVFSGLKGRVWDPETGFPETATYDADLYVFRFQIEKD